MKQKPSLKSVVVLNLVNNIPMAIVMSVTAPLVMGIPMVFSNIMENIVIAFLLACIVNLAVPIPLIAEKFSKLFKQPPESFAGRLLGNIPVCLIFVVIIGLILNAYNVRQFPGFIFAFFGTFIPMYLVCFVISMFTNPFAMKLAFGNPAAEKTV
ncbi:hypothetical protein INP51_15825 [Blautia liquoris]|uniref:Uncharacterized protein n=1 Tax=Blautia liquoris TaxID=2779518 RepID=A0A7M2RIL1_9FIRM|nr:hypothetical protein [Blautia liquoris]QOV19377.1 hypothetical protein INP51_15825 [Blautia liquoris]